MPGTREGRSSERAAAGLLRREFLRGLAGLASFGLLEPAFAALALGDPKRLSWMANRTAGREGVFPLTEVEGELPVELRGTLYRVAPGQSSNHGVVLEHMFDGDAFVSAYSFRDGKAWLNARFVELPERVEELAAGRMLYNEFGTSAPASDSAAPKGRGKNQPSINVIHWDGRLLALSEGGHPTELDPSTLAYRSRWDFHGTLPSNVSFTGHPKFDPKTGVGYGYGLEPGVGLVVFRMEANGRLTRLHSVPLEGARMVHDMTLSEHRIVFVLAPLRFDREVLRQGGRLANALRYFEDEPLRVLILDRAGGCEPKWIDQPASVVFHNGNAFEQDGRLLVDTIMSPNNDVNRVVSNWSKDQLPEALLGVVTRLAIDLDAGEVVERTEWHRDIEFPRFDIRRIGQKLRYLYCAESGIEGDAFALTRLVRQDLVSGGSEVVEAGPGRAIGEVVFTPRPGGTGETDGWLIHMGYDAGRDENFVEIRDAASLELAARVWAGSHYPLGFHGNFVDEVFVDRQP